MKRLFWSFLNADSNPFEQIMKYTLLSLLGLLLVAGCGVEPGENPGRADAIESGWIVISADTDRAYLDRRITITARCKPTVKGKGRIGLMGSGDFRDSSIWIVKWPVQDTVLDRDREQSPVVLEALFDPDHEFVQQWQIQLYPQGELGARGYHFQVWATVDSTFIADSNRYFQTESIAVSKYSPGGRGLDPDATSTILRLERL